MDARVAFGGGSVTVWGGIILNGRTDLVVMVNQTINAERYGEMCILQHVVPFAQNFGEGFILVDDNAPPHRAQIIEEMLTTHNIERMNWPARSPDCNPIEHVWDELQRRLRSRQEAPRNLHALANALVEEWEQLPLVVINNLIESMPRRCEAVRRSRGGPTRY